MRFDIISLFPEMFQALNSGIVGRALRNNIIEIYHWNPRDYAHDPYRMIDDRPYGGGPGMVMKFEPLRATIQAARNAVATQSHVVHLTPQGKVLTQKHLSQLSRQIRLILIAGRYEGIDERLIKTDIDEEYSVGDYIVSGGELPAMIMIDAITRLLPGVLGNDKSVQQDSFAVGLLDHPHYTRPKFIGNQCVPKVLLSGDHQAIARWRLKQALGRTWQRRPDLIKRRILTEQEQQLLDDYMKE